MLLAFGGYWPLRRRTLLAGLGPNCAPSRASPSAFSGEGGGERSGAGEGLVDDAVALGELAERGELLLAGVGVELEGEAYVGETNGRVAVDAEGAAEVEVTLCAYVSGGDRDLKRGGDGAERDAGAGDERLQQHVPGAEQRPVAAGGGVQAGLRDGVPGCERAGDSLPECAGSGEREQRRAGLGLVAVLQRRLQLPQLISLHARDVRRTIRREALARAWRLRANRTGRAALPEQAGAPPRTWRRSRAVRRLRARAAPRRRGCNARRRRCRCRARRWRGRSAGRRGRAGGRMRLSLRPSNPAANSPPRRRDAKRRRASWPSRAGRAVRRRAPARR